MKDQKHKERIDKIDIDNERALDEIYSFKEQMRLLQDERRRDIEETADFIKQLIDTQKADWSKDMGSLRLDVDNQKKDMIDRCSLKEMLAIKNNLASQLDNKVELKEV